ncbi:MAG TPA: hydrogenase nickel incorporation protein HypB [Rhodocyclaceae bacterium]|nr:hydrogenase nickel incorporation protein HypB [Rhodocyclaceae bacterium]
MCTTCGCGAGETRIEGQDVDRDDPNYHVHADGTAHVHAPSHAYSKKAHAHPHRHADGSSHTHEHEHHGEHQHSHGDTTHGHVHTHADGTTHVHEHDHVAEHQHSHAADHDHGTLDYGRGAAGAHAPGMTQSRMVQIERDILSKNDAYAQQNRQVLADAGILALNFVSSPGSGKTTLLCRTITELRGQRAVAVIEGDQQTANDAQRIRATGAPAIQINTGKGCHLDAHMVGRAIEQLRSQQQLASETMLFIENVGNLVCPAAFDLGEAAKVAILSVTEGEDKPLKYPDMFRAARLMLLNKVDLLPHLTFDVGQAIAAARRVNPQIEVIQVSATSGAGMAEWLAWLEARLAETRQRQLATVDALRRRVAELETRLAAQQQQQQ